MLRSEGSAMEPGDSVKRQGLHRRLRPVTVVMVLILSGLALWLGYIGAFGGRLYFELPARPTPATRDVAAVIFSGDMGFRIGMAPRIGQAIAAAGIPVTGVSSLVHFRTRRSPAEVRTFIAAAMAHAERVTGARHLILIGQSYGADMLHVGLSTMPAAQRRKIAAVVLVVPTDTVYFRISPAELFEWTEPDAPALPTARMLDWLPVVCIRGVRETNSLCPMLRQGNVGHVALPGGHKLNGDSAALSAAVLHFIRARLAHLH